MILGHDRGSRSDEFLDRIWPRYLIDLEVKLIWNMFQHQNIKNWPYYAIDIMIQTLSVRIICLFVCQSQIPSLWFSDNRWLF